MKKYLQLSLFSAGVSAAALLFASTGAYAVGNYKGENFKGEAMPAPCPIEKSLKDGFYVGAQVGYDNYRVQVNNADAIVSLRNSLAVNGWVGGIYAGYGQYFNDTYYLAAEVLASTTGAYGTNNTDGSVDKVGMNRSYGVRLLPGIKLNSSTLLYVPLGYINTGWNARGFVPSTGVASVRTSERSHAFTYGLGVETALYENFSLRAEYSYADYTSRKRATYKWSPVNNQFMLGLTYHFA